jgi:hypothetical protein
MLLSSRPVVAHAPVDLPDCGGGDNRPTWSLHSAGWKFRVSSHWREARLREVARADEAGRLRAGDFQNWSLVMPAYAPEVITVMRAVLDAVMTQIPVDHATPAIKVRMAEIILRAAAEGQTSYDGLLATASDQIQTILSLWT